jgi:hypothetical protein
MPNGIIGKGVRDACLRIRAEVKPFAFAILRGVFAFRGNKVTIPVRIPKPLIEILRFAEGLARDGYIPDNLRLVTAVDISARPHDGNALTNTCRQHVTVTRFDGLIAMRQHQSIVDASSFIYKDSFHYCDSFPFQI